ncbi:alpha/beta-hydrolase [Calocera cornea HHB12733]|uniref:Alpha/beta-hydrolase n=1 Tax=Calocera cornea HHB12733 TaxID=1353952 RepID=A0A165E645_9BASI|nr:alpha/beta-hydrolase [Calocera cornea HHB12733]
MSVPVASFTTSADGTKLFYSSIGDPSLPALIWIHGQSFSSIAFDTVFSDPLWLKQVFLVRYDVRGHGRSEKPTESEAYSQKKLAEDFDAVVEATGARNVFVVAWSAGGALLPDIIMYSKTTVRGAVLIAGVPHLGVARVVATPELLGLMFKGLLSTDDVDFAHQALFKVTDMLVYRPDRDMPYARRAMLFGDAAAQPPNVRKAYLLRSQDAQPWLDMGEKMCEMLLVHGRQDSGVLPQKTLDVMRKAFGNRATPCWIDDCGHSPFLEKPDECRRGILAFVDSVICADRL